MRRCVVFFLLTLLLFSAAPGRASAADNTLFINLTSDEVNRAAMAIMLAKRVLVEEGIPVTIFLNVEGVRVADRRLPQGTNADGNSPRQMLAEFIAAGGTVYLCPMCMKNVGGMTSDDMIEGIQLASMENTLGALFEEGSRVLSY